MFLELIQNMALLISLAVILQVLARRTERKPALYESVTGLLFGCVGIVGMMTPMHFAEGVIYDGRSIILSLAGIFGGPIAALLSAVMCGVYRGYLGGPGALAGILTITESAALGAVYGYLRRRDEAWVTPFKLWCFALLVHVLMLAAQLLIPEKGLAAVLYVGPSVLIFYPLVFMLIAQVFLDDERRRRSENALRESQERLDLVLRGAELGAWDWHIVSNRVTFNERWATMLGYEVGELSPHYDTWERLVHPDDSKRVIEALQDHVKGHSDSYEVEYRLKRKDGDWAWVLDKGRVIERTADGKPIRACGTHLDITERKLAEETREKLEEQLKQAHKMEAVGQLAGGIAHDFNNLLQVILGNADLLSSGLKPDDPNFEILDEVRRAGERASELTQQLLAFSRRQIIQPVNLDLNDLIQSVLRMIRRIIGEHIELRFIPGDRLGLVYADKGQIEQIVLNLCVNARDAMPTGGTLTIETENVIIGEAYCREHLWATEGRYVLLSVTDSGVGMDELTQAHIFEPFFTTKGVGQGTGLGLATVYGIVKRHSGLVHVYSELDKGTTFKIYLPITERFAEEVGAKIEPRVVGGSETILVAEDEEMVRNLVVRILESAGYSVLSAVDGEDALRVFEAHADRINLALLDVMMPKLGGKEVMNKMLERRPDMRVLFSSGYSENAVHANFVIKTGLRLISKPYRSDELLRAVRETLDAPLST
ncbi:MAG: PAS domain-containing protein [Candidatus Hydrogenedentes bacterium]|nr:PAS domain-containing protein [Candidatus Hydrogenedentota bacterium]